ncbi:MAG: tetratricopeptide repeat protein, partial [Candidatus Acidiferrales bacterium]
MKAAKSWNIWIVLIAAACLLSGCHRSPAARKTKFARSGSEYFQQGKYREAAIQYENAIQIDPYFADAHYQLAQCLLKLKDWSGAYGELSRTVEIDPTNWNAQLDLGGLLVAGGRIPEAREHAETVL